MTLNCNLRRRFLNKKLLLEEVVNYVDLWDFSHVFKKQKKKNQDTWN